MSKFADLWRKLNTVIRRDSLASIAKPIVPRPLRGSQFDEFPLELVIRFDDNRFGPNDFYRRVREHAAALGVDPEVALEEHAGERVSLDYLVDKYEFCGYPSEVVGIGGIRATFVGGVERARYAGLTIEGGAALNADADAWVRLLADVPGFLQAYLIAREFDFWQNAERPSFYQSFGRSLAGLTFKPNGLPPPHFEEIVDTSQHPGRLIPRRPLVEVVASQLWLSDRFWTMVGKTRASFTADPTVAAVTDFAPGIVKLTAAAEPFTDGASAATLDALRLAIYGETTELKS